jgi:hypothetical protein
MHAEASAGAIKGIEVSGVPDRDTSIYTPVSTSMLGCASTDRWRIQ